MKKYTAEFALVGTIMIALLLGTLNYITTPDTLWFFYPVFAVAWWPLSVYFCSRRQFQAFSFAGSLLIIAFLAITNLITSPGTLWFLYAALPVLGWPIAYYFRKALNTTLFSIVFSIFIILYYTFLNQYLTPGYFWAIYPIYATIWWPLSRFYNNRKDYKRFSIAGSLLTIVFLIVSNLFNPSHPWALYACYPVIWWPIAIYFGKRLGALAFSIICTICTIAWYGMLNFMMSPGYPWTVFIAYSILWWPVSVYYAGRKKAFSYAAIMTAISAAFFSYVNYISSPGALWAIYPIFAFLWWPAAIYFSKEHDSFGFSIAGTILLITLLATINLTTSSGFLWSILPILCILWWPVSVYFANRKDPFGFSLGGTLLASILFISVNLLTSPGFLWCVFPIFAVLWWPLGVYFFASRKCKT